MKKKKLWRHIAILLSFCLVCTSIPAMAYGADVTDSESSTKEEDQNITYLDPEDVSPEDALKDESGLDYTTYSLGGEKKLSVFYTQNVRFEDKEGNLEDYDPSLVTIAQTRQAQEALQDYAYQNKAGDSKQYIPEELSEETPVVMEKDNYSITMTPTEKTYKDFFGKKVKVKREKHKVEDAYNQVKEKNIKALFKEKTALAYVEYTSMPEGLKEDIVLTKRPSKNVLQFEIKADGLTPEVSELDGSVCFFDKKTGELVNMIDPPNMNDATGDAYSEELYYEIEEKKVRQIHIY